MEGLAPPTPYLSKSQGINIPKLIKKKEFEIISNEKIKYKIIFELLSSNLISNLSITAFPEKSVIKYKKIFTLEDIQKVKLFIAFDNLEECFEEIIEGLNMNQNKIIKEKNKINLIISLRSKKYNEIIFDLDKEEFDIEDKLQKLSIENEKNKAEIKFLNNENNNLKKEISNIKKELDDLKNVRETIYNKKVFSYIKYPHHSCYLILVDHNNKNKIYLEYSGWSCNECQKLYDKQIPCFYCPKCDYDLCLECFKNNENKYL